MHTVYLYELIYSFDELANLHERKTSMFTNLLLSDGYTCRAIFVRECQDTSSNSTQLVLEDFNRQEIDRHFTPTYVDPGRTTAITSIRDDGQVRSLNNKEYYSMSSRTKMLKKSQRKKERCGLNILESNIPSPKTSNYQNYENYTVYLLKHLHTFFEFYNQDTAEDRWRLFCARQSAIDEAVNILINGGKKYNPEKRKGHKRRKRRKKQDNEMSGVFQRFITYIKASIDFFL